MEICTVLISASSVTAVKVKCYKLENINVLNLMFCFVMSKFNTVSAMSCAQSGDPEDLCLLVCDDTSSGELFPTFRRHLVQDCKFLFFFDCLTLENEGTNFLLNVVRCLHKRSALHSQRPEENAYCRIPHSETLFTQRILYLV